jgi:formylglycine-generating enzyme required for sulfatase activity
VAQGVTPRIDPPGWRAEQELIEWLDELALQTEAVRGLIAGVNDDTFTSRVERILVAAAHVTALHLPEPRDGVAEDLDGLERATDLLRIPLKDPDLGERTPALDQAGNAMAALLRAIMSARRAAEAARGVVFGPNQIAAIDPAKVNAMLRRLDQVESELRIIAVEKTAPDRFIQQAGLVNLYVEKMRVKIDLARLQLSIDGTTFDLGALTRGVAAMGDVTSRFQANVRGFLGLVTQALSAAAEAVGRPVTRVVLGAGTLARFAVWEQKKRGARQPAAVTSAVARQPGEPEMVLIQPGSFLMGVSEAEQKAEGGSWDEHARPLHTVSIPRPFLLGKYPVTKGEYAEFAAATGRDWAVPEFPQTDRHPAVNVSWDDAVAYAGWLSRRTGHRYRLPSEAEWEYACRAGTTTARYWGDKLDRAKGNFDDKGTTEVDTYPSNPWGLHDMLGNVFEWVEDTWHATYEGAPSDGTAWVANDETGRVLRGGSWGSVRRDYRSGFRGGSGSRPAPWVGFRLARTL